MRTATTDEAFSRLPSLFLQLAHSQASPRPQSYDFRLTILRNLSQSRRCSCLFQSTSTLNTQPIISVDVPRSSMMLGTLMCGLGNYDSTSNDFAHPVSSTLERTGCKSKFFRLDCITGLYLATGKDLAAV
jgi:hypothetical protein